MHNAWRAIVASVIAVGFSGPMISAAEQVAIFDVAHLEVPASWKRTEPQSRIVEHEFVVPAEEGDDTARLTMMAAGGDVQANIDRWKSQFADGKPEDQKTEKLTVEGQTVHLVRLSGTFRDNVGGGPFFGGRTVVREDYAMHGAIIETEGGGKYFLKLVGPEKVVAANAERFVKMVKEMKEAGAP